jgi:flagellar biosynthetic protein FliQ
MDTSDVIELSKEAIWVTMMIGAPLLLTALVIGLIISLIQALTQIQEMTLAFVPKVVGMFAIFLLTMPFMIATLSTFTRDLAARIAAGGGG